MLRSLLVSLTFATPALADVTLINVFEVPAGRHAEAVAAWEASRDFLAAQPGYVDTTLYSSLAEDARFRLINVAHWTSPEAFARAIAAMRATGLYPQVDGLGITPALYHPIRKD